MRKLTNTIRTEVDNDYFMDIADFRDYARSMMFPDPVGIDMSDEFNDMVTEAVNSGKTTLEDAGFFRSGQVPCLARKRPVLWCRMSASGGVQCNARAVGIH